jgi:hypothetical protein
MIYLLLIILFLIVSVFFWPYASIFLWERLADISGCQDGDAGASSCGNVLSQIGAVGDTFSPLSSVLTGLTLAAVALTLYVEGKARKEARKPLIVSEIGEDTGISFDEPNFNDPCSVRVTIELSIVAMNDVAMNVCVSPTLQSGKWMRKFDDLIVSKPMGPDGKAVQREFRIRLQESDISKLLGDQKSELLVQASFNSIEGVLWSTEVRYRLSFRDADRKRLAAIKQEETADRALWDNAAAATAEHELVAGSWKHSK